MSEEPEITKAMAEAARLVEYTLKEQAPRKTGRLRDSISVTPSMTEAGNLSLKATYEEYGVFLDYGTGPFNTYPNRGRFNSSPKSGVGLGGIFPRYWTSLSSSVRLRATQIFREAVAKVTKMQLKRMKLTTK